MCLAPAIIDERAFRLTAFIAATRQLIIANQENETRTYSGALVLLNEVETGLTDFANELKACQKGPAND